MLPLPDSTVFSRADARALGWSDPAFTRAVRAGVVVRLRRDQFARADVDLRAGAAEAATRSVRGSVISHRWAAHLHDRPLLNPLPPLVDLTVPPSGTGDAAGTRLHRATLAPDEITMIGGIPVTSPARTAVDIARSRSRTEAVVVIDDILQGGLASVAEIDAVTLRCWNWPGMARAQRALRLVDARAESPLESISRLAIGSLRLPRPETQVSILGEAGFVGRVDFYWDEFGVVGEADGRMKYESRDVIFEEKLRQERLEALGLVVVRWGWDDVRARPRALKTRLESAFERGWLRDRSGVPRLWSVATACRDHQRGEPDQELTGAGRT